MGGRWVGVSEKNEVGGQRAKKGRGSETEKKQDKSKNRRARSDQPWTCGCVSWSFPKALKGGGRNELF